jgi:hypothetical protein
MMFPKCKKEKLPVKESGSDGVTARETVTKPIHKWTIKKRRCL